MFVVMALVTTLATTSLTTVLYGNRLFPEHDSEQGTLEKLKNTSARRLLVYLRLDSPPIHFRLATRRRRTGRTSPTGPGPSNAGTHRAHLVRHEVFQSRRVYRGGSRRQHIPYFRTA